EQVSTGQANEAERGREGNEGRGSLDWYSVHTVHVHSLEVRAAVCPKVTESVINCPSMVLTDAPLKCLMDTGGNNNYLSQEPRSNANPLSVSSEQDIRSFPSPRDNGLPDF